MNKKFLAWIPERKSLLGRHWEVNIGSKRNVWEMRSVFIWFCVRVWLAVVNGAMKTRAT
jgi:hypothetical protein